MDKFDSEKQAGYIWFKFFPMDWMTDPIVVSMTLAHQALYLWFLCQQWNLGGFLPADLKVCASLCKDSRTTAKFLQKYADLCFPVQTCGKRANAKLLNLAIESGKVRVPENTEETQTQTQTQTLDSKFQTSDKSLKVPTVGCEHVNLSVDGKTCLDCGRARGSRKKGVGN